MINDEDIWHFQDLYRVLFDLADSTDNVISRKGGRNVTDELANDFSDRWTYIKNKYPNEVSPELRNVANYIEILLSELGHGGSEYTDSAWNNSGFINNRVWQQVQKMAKAYIFQIIARDA